MNSVPRRAKQVNNGERNDAFGDLGCTVHDGSGGLRRLHRRGQILRMRHSGAPSPAQAKVNLKILHDWLTVTSAMTPPMGKVI